jgi:hypothetical protein
MNDIFKVNQVWKPKGWYSGGYVVTAVGRIVVSLKIDGDPEAKDNIAVTEKELDGFLSECKLMPYKPSFPV